MRYSRFFSRVSPRLWGWGLLALLIALSLLPSSVKVQLHTRGAMHYWAHVYLFAGLAALFLQGADTAGQRAMVVLRLALLGLAIEVFQARAHLAYLETTDVASDLAGAALGTFVSLLRSGALARDPFGIEERRESQPG